MEFLNEVKEGFIQAVKSCFDTDLNSGEVLINETRKEFKGDFTFVIFPLVKKLKKSPAEIGDMLGHWLVENLNEVVGFETIQGFLNLTLSDEFWIRVLRQINSTADYGSFPANGQKVLVEFASPNTNKPLHLGHIRNILLGWSCSKILKANGFDVKNVQVINDRGIAICKSMLAWQKFGNHHTPQSAGVKGDHFVGSFYVKFEQAFVEEYKIFQQSDAGQKLYQSEGNGKSPEVFFKEFKNQYFNQYSTLGAAAKEMLIKWEQGDPDTIVLWKMMNSWVYEGFNATYDQMGVSFDALYYESETYLLGKKAIESGLNKGIFYKEPDGSVWINLEDVGMDRKILLRSDGTSVYITQDIGTAQQRYEDFGVEKMIYTVADEQDYHFKVLFEILKRLEEPFADGLYHLSYGMVDLPSGRMKSREGTVVDADDLMQEVIEEARSVSAERGEIAALPQSEQDEILRKIGLAALKFFIIKVQPRKRMIFDPKESVDMQGQTGPYIQNAYVRIQSVMRKASSFDTTLTDEYTTLSEFEKTLIRNIMQMPDVIREAGKTYDPSILANYAYNLAKEYHRFYHEVRILNAETDAARAFRTTLSENTGKVLLKVFDLLGMEMPERM
ncbi:MAG: arginine--tRNA ligase [Saprospiraceae bacterium]|nr:MAG: arginyl-tRNA synthetase [Bacteroidetes bacterium OLB9]MCO6463589.1 arginine--tRNA ligase [Saprospiraceae bacterium]